MFELSKCLISDFSFLVSIFYLLVMRISVKRIPYLTFSTLVFDNWFNLLLCILCWKYNLN